MNDTLNTCKTGMLKLIIQLQHLIQLLQILPTTTYMFSFPIAVTFINITTIDAIFTC